MPPAWSAGPKPPPPMRKARTLAYVVTLAVAASAAPSADAQTAPDSVRAAFDRYRSALLAGDGPAAVEAVDPSGVGLYGRHVALALDADSAQVRGLGVADRMAVLSLRHRVPADTLRAFDGAAALAYGVERRWIDGLALRLVTPGDVRVKGDRAWMGTGAADGSEIPLRRSRGVWRVDLAALAEESGPALLAMAAEAGMTEDEFVAFALETLTGRPVGPDVWRPLARR